jgi:hypothetical protein
MMSGGSHSQVAAPAIGNRAIMAQGCRADKRSAGKADEQSACCSNSSLRKAAQQRNQRR